MSTTPQNFLDLAKSIEVLGGEAGYRSAVSRSYYASFHLCKSWLSTLPGVASSGSGPEGGEHQKLINQLANPAPEVKCPETRKLSKVLSARLSSFRMQRVASDYFLNEVAPYKDWSSNAIAGVELMFEQLAARAQSESKTAVSESPSQKPELSDEAGVGLMASVLPAAASMQAQVGKRPALKRVK